MLSRSFRGFFKEARHPLFSAIFHVSLCSDGNRAIDSLHHLQQRILENI